METTYLQKLVLAVVLGAVAAGGLKWFDTFVTGANESVNEGYDNFSGED
jgi:hypothetical protein